MGGPDLALFSRLPELGRTGGIGPVAGCGDSWQKPGTPSVTFLQAGVLTRHILAVKLIPTCRMPAKQQGPVFPALVSFRGARHALHAPCFNLLSRSHLRKGPGDCPGKGEWLGEKEASAFHTVELYSNE